MKHDDATAPLSTEERQSLYTRMSQWARNTDLQFEQVVKWINETLQERAKR